MALPAPGQAAPPAAIVAPPRQPPRPVTSSPIGSMLAALALHMRGARPGSPGGPVAIGARVPLGQPAAPPPAGQVR
jgi:hypothetical protein